MQFEQRVIGLHFNDVRIFIYKKKIDFEIYRVFIFFY